MELIISAKNGKYYVTDKKDRNLYTVKKKAFGKGKFVLHDASNYNLYTLSQIGDERKPAFNISHNEKGIISLSCKSMFLDPTINVKGKDTSGTAVMYDLVSKDHRDFKIVRNGDEEVGSITTRLTAAGDFQYGLEIEDKIFDDYIPLFAVAVDLAFADMNQSINN